MFDAPMRYDCAIIGTGPAGISAVLTLKSMNKTFIWFGSANLSQKIRKAEMIFNYPGLSCISGEEMTRAFLDQIQQMEIELTEKTVTSVLQMGDYYGLLCDQEMFEAKTVILATGVESVKPILGELELLGAGVSYCATCDGMLYRGKKIAVVILSTFSVDHKNPPADLFGVSGIIDLQIVVPFTPIIRSASCAELNR